MKLKRGRVLGMTYLMCVAMACDQGSEVMVDAGMSVDMPTDISEGDLGMDLDTSGEMDVSDAEDVPPDLAAMDMMIDRGISTRVWLSEAHLSQGRAGHDNRVVPSSAFAPDPEAIIEEGDELLATLTLTPEAHAIGVWRDDGARAALPEISRPPTLRVGLVSRDEDGALVPTDRGFVGQSETWWAMVGVGSTWREPGDGGKSRAALPLTLVEPFANCSFHGVVTWLYDAQDAAISDAYYQISQETCLYFKADMWGWFGIEHEALDTQRASTALREAESELLERLPVRPLEDLEGVNLSAFFTQRSTQHVTTHGVVVDGVHYSGGCPTRQGQMPWCEGITLPSYSTAKSAVAGMSYLAMRRDEASIGETKMAEVMDVPASWSEVTLAQLLDMRSGHYDEVGYMADEDGARQFEFFLAREDEAKFQVALSYPSWAGPAPWVYHTSDTFLAVRMMQHMLGQDLFGWLVERVFAPLGMSATSRAAYLRTVGGQTQHFGGYGSFWLPGDVGLLGEALHAHARGERDDVFEVSEVARVMQRETQPVGVQAVPGLRYHRGFWGLDVDESMGFACRRTIAFMSGFGGITIALLPNGVTYYVFRDDAEFDWLGAARELSKLGDFCAL